MPYFVISCTDKPDSLDLRLATRPAHLEHLDRLKHAVVAAGALLDRAGQPSGSMIVAEFADEAAAAAFAEADPYARAGLFADVRIQQWRKVLPAD